MCILAECLGLRTSEVLGLPWRESKVVRLLLPTGTRQLFPSIPCRYLKPLNLKEMWRRRVEVESTTRSAKERVAGFEGREGHRTPFAPMGV